MESVRQRMDARGPQFVASRVVFFESVLKPCRSGIFSHLLVRSHSHQLTLSNALPRGPSRRDRSMRQLTHPHCPVYNIARMKELLPSEREA